MEPLNTALGPRAHQMLLDFAEKRKLPIGPVLTLMILEYEQWAGWNEMDDLIDQIAILKKRERRHRDRLRKTGTSLPPRKTIEDYFEAVVESNFEITEEE